MKLMTSVFNASALDQDVAPVARSITSPLPGKLFMRTLFCFIDSQLPTLRIVATKKLLVSLVALKRRSPVLYSLESSGNIMSDTIASITNLTHFCYTVNNNLAGKAHGSQVLRWRRIHHYSFVAPAYFKEILCQKS